MSGWKKLKSRIIHKNPWYNLREDDVVRPDGSKGKYFYIDGVDSIVVIAEDSNKTIYLIGQHRYSLGNRYSWEVIEGGVKSGLDSFGVAKQELREEAGLIAKKWTSLGYFFPQDGYSKEKCCVYLARNLITKQTRPGPTEDITIKKERIEKVLTMIDKNEIISGITIAAILKYLRFLKKSY